MTSWVREDNKGKVKDSKVVAWGYNSRNELGVKRTDGGGLSNGGKAHDEKHRWEFYHPKNTLENLNTVIFEVEVTKGDGQVEQRNVLECLEVYKEPKSIISGDVPQKWKLDMATIQNALRSRSKDLNFQNLWEMDMASADKINKTCSKHIDKWKKVMQENVFNKFNTYVQYQTKLEDEKNMPKVTQPGSLQVTQNFLKNIQLYETIVGLLYLHPCYLFQLLIKKSSFEEEKVLNMIYRLYTENTGTTQKNKSYLISMCKMLLKSEREDIIKKKLSLSDYETKFVKIYRKIIERSPITINYFNRLKQNMLPLIVKYCSDYLESTASNPIQLDGEEISEDAIDLNPEGNDGAPGLKILGAALTMKQSMNVDTPSIAEPERTTTADQLHVCLKEIIDSFLDMLNENFSDININETILGLDLVALNYEIYGLFKQMNSESLKAKLDGQLSNKRMVVAILFSYFFNLLGTRDAIWINGVEKHEKYSERLSSHLSIVLDQICKIFQKAGERGLLEKKVFGLNETGEPFYPGLVQHYGQTIHLIFKGIAKSNNDLYDNSLLNASENLKHTFSNDTDMVSIPLGEIIRLKNLLVKCFKDEQLEKDGNSDATGADDTIFLTRPDTYNALRVVISYINEDEFEYDSIDITDLHINLNIKLRNKFFFYDRIDPDKLKLHKCTSCELILPYELLRGQDQDVLRVIEKSGWPCFMSGDGQSGDTPHYYNPLAS